MKKFVIALVVFFAVALGIYLIAVSSSSVTGNVVAEKTAGSNMKTFVVDSAHLRFYMNGAENPDIRVKEGDKVGIDFTSSEGFHDWKVDEFNAATEKVNPGQKTSVEFVADKKGTFEYYCSVGKHRQNGMFGKFIVE